MQETLNENNIQGSLIKRTFGLAKGLASNDRRVPKYDEVRVFTI